MFYAAYNTPLIPTTAIAVLLTFEQFPDSVRKRKG